MTLSETGYIKGLNVLLSGIFPLIPWELFFFLPWSLVYLAKRATREPVPEKGTIPQLILFITIFAAVYGGLAHPLGLVQAFDTLAGGEGICVVHPPPMGADPFQLYYGYSGHPWCYFLAIHVISVCFVGWYFLYTLIFVDRKKAAERGNKWELVNPPESLFHFRCALWFFVVGWSQALPYLGDASHIGDPRGGYSKRLFTPAIVENLAAWSWIASGAYFFWLYKQTAKVVPKPGV